MGWVGGAGERERVRREGEGASGMGIGREHDNRVSSMRGNFGQSMGAIRDAGPAPAHHAGERVPAYGVPQQQRAGGRGGGGERNVEIMRPTTMIKTDTDDTSDTF